VKEKRKFMHQEKKKTWNYRDEFELQFLSGSIGNELVGCTTIFAEQEALEIY
jgi:hypothetical protein